jgi:aspartate/methionine/tyrosine aminotransferase
MGILVTPGSLYGSNNFVRIALTATDENIDKAIARINS